MENYNKENNTNQEVWYISPISFIMSIIIVIFTWKLLEYPSDSNIIFKAFRFLFYHISIFIIAYFSGAIGNLLRMIAMPDAFFSRGFLDTLKEKLFWSIGPQVIGSVGGVFIFIMIFEKWITAK